MNNLFIPGLVFLEGTIPGGQSGSYGGGTGEDGSMMIDPATGIIYCYLSEPTPGWYQINIETGETSGDCIPNPGSTWVEYIP